MNWDMLGHEWAVELLRKHVAQGRVRHAYLITGPEGVGRRTLALRLAQAINCPQPPSPGEPCRTCRTCRQIEAQQHPDLSVVEAEERGGALKVEQVRELQHSLALAPYDARYRFAILLRFEEAHKSASASAPNALLKTLEEPPPQVVLAVTAQDAEHLLPTIVSRCEQLRLRLVPAARIEAGLQEQWGVPEDEARLLARISGGRPGYALRLHREPDLRQQRLDWLEQHTQLLAQGRVERFAYVDALSKDRDALRGALNVWLSFWRDVLLKTSGAEAPPTNLDRRAEIDALAGQLDLQSARKMVAALERALALLDRYANARLLSEVLMLDLPRI